MPRDQLGVTLARGHRAHPRPACALTAEAAAASASRAATRAGDVPDMEIRRDAAGVYRRGPFRSGASHYRTGGKIRGWNRFRPPRSAGRRPPSSSSPACATTPGTGTTTPRSPPTSSIRWSNTRPYPVYAEEVVITADSKRSAGVSVPFHDRSQAGPVQPRGAGPAEAVRRAGRVPVLGRLQPRRERARTRRASSRRCGRSFPAPRTLAKLPAKHPLYRCFLPVSRRSADDVARAERVGRRHRPRLPARGRAPRPRRACCIRTRTTAASGTTTGGTSASSGRTTRSSRSTSSSTR